MLIFFDPTQPPPWRIKIVKDEHPAVIYVSREGLLFDLREEGLQCLELDHAAEVALRPYRRILHKCTVEVVDGQAVLNLPDQAEPQLRSGMMLVPPGIRRRAHELAQMRRPMEAPPPMRIDAETLLRRKER